MEKSEHLIIPACREKHGYKVSHELNHVLVNRCLSKNLTRLFGKQTPLEQLAVFHLITRRVLSDGVRRDLMELCLTPEEVYYRDEVLNGELSSDGVWKALLMSGKDLFPLDAHPRPSLSNHHIVPSSLSDEGFSVRDPLNIIPLPFQFHRNWHHVFRNEDPKRAIERLFQIQRRVIRMETRERIAELFGRTNEVFYREEILTPVVN